MLSETTKELLAARDQIKVLKAELEAAKTKKKATMETLKVRFPTSIHSGCDMLADQYDWQWNKSDVARAAMYLGLQQLNEVGESGFNRINGLMHIINLRMKFQK